MWVGGGAGVQAWVIVRSDGLVEAEPLGRGRFVDDEGRGASRIRGRAWLEVPVGAGRHGGEEASGLLGTIDVAVLVTVAGAGHAVRGAEASSMS